MAHGARTSGSRTIFPRARTFGPAAVTARQRFAWLWSRESLLRLILSFVLSVALWLYVSNKQNPDIAQDFTQPLSITQSATPVGMTVLSVSPGKVYVSIKHTDPSTPVTAGSFHPFVDLTGLQPGTHRVKVQIIADPGIDVVAKRPSVVTVVLEKIESRRVPVHYVAISRPPSGYGWSVTPHVREVTVSGPQPFVGQVARATFDVDLSVLRSTVLGSYTLRPENSEGSFAPGPLNLSPSHIPVTVAIQPMSSYRSVPLLVSFSGQPRSGYSVVQATIDPPQITITGSPQRLRGISSIKLQPVSLAKRGPGTFVSHARPLLPKGISSHTKTVNVHTQLAAVQASTSIQVGLIPTNVAPGLVAQIRPARVLATVVGPTNELQGAGANIRALVDLSNYGAGTSVIMPRLSVKGKLRVVGLYPSTVTVTLTPSA